MTVQLSKMRRAEFSTTVSGTMSGDKPGVKIPFSFQARFKFIKQSALDQLLEDYREGDITQTDILRENMIGLDGFADEEDGTDVPFDVAQDWVLETVSANDAAAKAFFDGVRGAQSKNSKKSRSK